MDVHVKCPQRTPSKFPHRPRDVPKEITSLRKELNEVRSDCSRTTARLRREFRKEVKVVDTELAKVREERDAYKAEVDRLRCAVLSGESDGYLKDCCHSLDVKLTGFEACRKRVSSLNKPLIPIVSSRVLSRLVLLGPIP